MQLGRYEVLRKLGEGGMARVLLARSATGNQVVLKVPFQQNADFAERVRDEARVGLRIHHPSVVDTLDLFEHDGRPILVVEYVEGASMQQLRRYGPMPPGLVARVGRQVADGLAFIHDASDENDKPLNILHRDVAPGNILITADGNAKLIDLGIARGLETKAKKTQIGTVRGTMRYLAPELLAGDKHLPATDLWALGVVLFEAALGRRAAEGDEREVLATIVRGDIGKLREGESLDPTLRDGIFALLAPHDARLQRAKAAMNVLKRIEESLHVDVSWSAQAVAAVLARMHERWAAEGAVADLADAATLVRPPEEGAPDPSTEDSSDEPYERGTAATLPSGQPGSAGTTSLPSQSVAPATPDPSQASAASSSAASSSAASSSAASSHAPSSPPRSGAEHKTSITDPRPRAALDSELGHADGAAPTVRMAAVDLGSDSSGAAATEIMPAVDVQNLVRDLSASRGPAAPPAAQPGFDQTQKFPKPGPATSPATLLENSGASLAWRSVAAPTLLGLTASDVAPATPAMPRTLQQQPSEPVFASEPDETTEAGAPPPQPPPGQQRTEAPVPPPGPTMPKSKEFSGPVPRMLQVENASLQNDTELAQPAVDLPLQAPVAAARAAPPAARPSPQGPLPEAHATPREPVGGPRRDPAHRAPDPAAFRDPAHRPPDPNALGIPQSLSAAEAAAATAAQAPMPEPEEATETAFPYGVPDSLTPSAPILTGAVPRLLSEPDNAPLPSLSPATPHPATPQPTTPQPAPAEAIARANARSPVGPGSFEDHSDRTMRVPPAPRAGFVGQSANPADATERVERWTPPGAAANDDAGGFEEPLLSGELDWRPNRTKHIALAAGVVVAIAVALGLLAALDVL